MIQHNRDVRFVPKADKVSDARGDACPARLFGEAASLIGQSQFRWPIEKASGN
jgi:hypothetical protein